MRLVKLVRWFLTFGAIPLLVGTVPINPAQADRDHDKDRKNYAKHDDDHDRGGKLRVVNCDRGGSIQRRIDRAASGDTVWVSGNCTENVTITQDDVSLKAYGAGASITGANITTPVITVRGRRISIVGFTLVGGSHVVVVTEGGSATIESNDISGANDSNGVLVTRNSFARIGGDSPSKGNDIHDNARGVNVGGASAADIFFNDIHHNERNIQVFNTGAVNMSDNLIRNSDRGLNLGFGGNASISSTPTLGGPNTFTDNNDAIRCRYGGSASSGIPSTPQIDGGGNNDLIDVSTAQASGCHISTSVTFVPITPP